jgi:hypothetical protein
MVDRKLDEGYVTGEWKLLRFDRKLECAVHHRV